MRIIAVIQGKHRLSKRGKTDSVGRRCVTTEGSIVPYTAEISRANPGCLLFVIDQSGSMAERLEEGSKADVVATTLNRVLQDLIIRCSKEEVYDYFDVGVMGYGHTGPANGLGGPLSGQILNPISQVASNPVRVDDRVRKLPDGAGGLI